MGIFDLFTNRRDRDAVYRLYAQIVGQARSPEFYNLCGVPDTVAGRFDLIGLHAYLVMRRLKEMDDQRGADLSQRLFDAMFADMDRNMREMGVGDLSVGKKVKALAKSFYGRTKAYDDGLAGGQGDLEQALRRNLFLEGDPADYQVSRMAVYLRESVAASSQWSIEQLEQGLPQFNLPPATATADASSPSEGSDQAAESANRPA
jgi:cytochrome b pre-mRNA-processing protein 3